MMVLYQALCNTCIFKVHHNDKCIHTDLFLFLGAAFEDVSKLFKFVIEIFDFIRSGNRHGIQCCTCISKLFPDYPLYMCNCDRNDLNLGAARIYKTKLICLILYQHSIFCQLQYNRLKTYISKGKLYFV